MFKKDLIKKKKSKFSLRGIIFLLNNPDLSKIEIFPYRDWRIVGICFFIMFLVSLGFNMYILFKVNRDSFFVVPETKNQGVLFDREGLHRTLDLIVTRDTIFERLKTESMKVGDPSL